MRCRAQRQVPSLAVVDTSISTSWSCSLVKASSTVR